jgi:hypothetical protein
MAQMGFATTRRQVYIFLRECVQPKTRINHMKMHLACLIAVLGLQTGWVYAGDQPALQEGLWEVRTRTVQNPGNNATDSIVKVCRDRAYDKFIQDLTQYRTGCTSSQADGADNTVKVSRRCVIGGSVVITEATVSVQSDAAHAESRMTFSPAWGGVTEQVDIQDQKYLGQCPANLKSGGIESASRN